MTFLRRHGFALLLLFVPLGLAANWFWPEHHTIVFSLAAVAIVPLAGYMGRATEVLTRHLGGGVGGLLNATFGNAAELILGMLALRAGLPNVVKASLTGAIIGNLLLVFGAAALVGGLRRRSQRFNQMAASTGTTTLLLSAIGLIVPAVFHWLSRNVPEAPELKLDTEIAIVLLASYGLSLFFMLRTHRHLYGAAAVLDGGEARTSLWQPIAMLVGAAAGVAWMSELLVGTITEAARAMNMSQLFVGVVIVAIIGNAAEHYSAVVLAAKDQMDAALSIAVGSSTQIALFVAPVLVFSSYLIAPEPMDLLFTVFEVVAIALAVMSVSSISHDGETHWFEGAQLLAIYLILVLGFYFLPPSL